MTMVGRLGASPTLKSHMAPSLTERLADKALRDLAHELADSHLRPQHLGYNSMIHFLKCFVLI